MNKMIVIILFGGEYEMELKKGVMELWSRGFGYDHVVYGISESEYFGWMLYFWTIYEDYLNDP